MSKNSRKNKRERMIPLAACTLAIVHLVLALLGYLNPAGVLVSAMICGIISMMMHFTIETSIKNHDFSLLAGHKKADETDLPRYEKQLRTMRSLVSSWALILNLLYVILYFSPVEKQMTLSLIFFGVFIVGLACIIGIVNYQFRSKANQK